MADVLAMSSSVPTAADDTNTASVPQTSKPSASNKPAGVLLSEVLPKAGLVYSEKGNLSELLCKPKLMPLKSVSMQKIEQMEQRMQEKLRQQQQQQ